MKWSFDEDTPIYLQIIDHFKAQIASGALPPGEKLASVRDLAMEAQVNPNTMQKALAELEREGYLYSKRTAGRFVSENHGQRDDLQHEMMMAQLDNFVANMKKLGYSLSDTQKIFLEYCQEHE